MRVYLDYYACRYTAGMCYICVLHFMYLLYAIDYYNYYYCVLYILSHARSLDEYNEAVVSLIFLLQKAYCMAIVY